jgi:hypothetical protein
MSALSRMAEKHGTMTSHNERMLGHISAFQPGENPTDRILPNACVVYACEEKFQIRVGKKIISILNSQAKIKYL